MTWICAPKQKSNGAIDCPFKSPTRHPTDDRTMGCIASKNQVAAFSGPVGEAASSMTRSDASRSLVQDPATDVIDMTEVTEMTRVEWRDTIARKDEPVIAAEDL
jgi:hypothetical protein